MPIYEYSCDACKYTCEELQSIKEHKDRKCPHCGHKLNLVLGKPGFIFKGTGYYVTDYKNK